MEISINIDMVLHMSILWYIFLVKLWKNDFLSKFIVTYLGTEGVLDLVLLVE
jgi:hypothetical protein